MPFVNFPLNIKNCLFDKILVSFQQYFLNFCQPILTTKSLKNFFGDIWYQNFQTIVAALICPNPLILEYINFYRYNLYMDFPQKYRQTLIQPQTLMFSK